MNEDHISSENTKDRAMIAEINSVCEKWLRKRELWRFEETINIIGILKIHCEGLLNSAQESEDSANANGDK